MGFESFRVELSGGRASFCEVDVSIRELPHMQSDPDSIATPGSIYYVMRDGRHVMELELRDSPIRLSCRFTLCHPASVDSTFLNLIRQLMTGLGMAVRICDDVRPEHTRLFSPNEFHEFSTAIGSYIAARRSQWALAFGDKPLAASTSEVHRQIISSRCQPADVK